MAGGWCVRRHVGRRGGADGAGGVGGLGGRAREAVLHSSRLTLGLSLETFFAAALHSGSSDLQWPHLEDSAGPCRAVVQHAGQCSSLDAAAAAWMQRLQPGCSGCVLG